MRLIDADKLPKYTGYALSASEVAKAVDYAPTVDAVPVVRCKDCKHRPYRNPNRTPTGAAIGWDCYSDDEVCPYVCDDPAYTTVPPDNGFCDRGERKGGDE